MKKIIATAFALAVAGPLLGATAAQALSIGINTGGHHRGHYRPVHHRHQVCSYRHHHRVCSWR